MELAHDSVRNEAPVELESLIRVSKKFIQMRIRLGDIPELNKAVKGASTLKGCIPVNRINLESRGT